MPEPEEADLFNNVQELPGPEVHREDRENASRLQQPVRFPHQPRLVRDFLQDIIKQKRVCNAISKRNRDG